MLSHLSNINPCARRAHENVRMSGQLYAKVSKTLEPALLDLVCTRELLAGTVAGDQPCHGILGA